MKFSLKKYSDLGKCAYATLMDEFDTEKNVIMLKGKKVEIKSLDDLFPFLWNIPGTAIHDNVKHTSVSEFSSKGTWWENRYTTSIEECQTDIKKMEKRFAKATDTNRKKLQAKIDYLKEHIESLRKMITSQNAEMEGQKLLLRSENGL